ncbi:CCA tRNA nucleotidyltransferase [Campylobacter sp. 19-13652]|uniref:CCA tRNA nucleotidyltransferase n=1 Tax=Campylobacter sp. 19-13652 TaxID=2840180 RepID=UPI001C799B33|nr:CCA tRNA nucleotidyltransferase [Campylobacter sp. 19-13652]BCX79123.1 multifunctional CCA protein [Campylobacter sp. 19-13652]
MKISLNSDLLAVKDALSPYTKRVYFVGGCVRDALLGRDIYDYDIEVYGISPDKFDKIMQKLGSEGVGKSYFIYKFKNIDIGLARSESCVGSGHRDFAVKYEDDPRFASLRRDFSVNAMMIDIFSGELLDFWGGMKDLQDKTLRHIDSDKFSEDSLRVLRGVQFASRFGFKIAPSTLKLMCKLSISNLSTSRISTELLKFFRADYLEIGVRYLFILGLFSELFGISLSKARLRDFIYVLKTANNDIKDETLFLYLLGGFFGVSAYDLARRLGLLRRFSRLKNEPYFSDTPSDFELVRIALRRPLKQWLGCYAERKKRALELNIFEKKLDFCVDNSKFNSLKSDEIAKEVFRQENEFIKAYLKV